MDEEEFPNQIIFIKYRKEKNMKKVLIAKRYEDKIVKITTIEEGIIDIIEREGEEHIYESSKT